MYWYESIFDKQEESCRSFEFTRTSLFKLKNELHYVYYKYVRKNMHQHL